MRRAILIALALLVVPALVFGQGHMRAVRPHPPIGGPGPDMFGGASSFSVFGKVTAVNGNLISIASGLVVVDATDAKIANADGDGSTIAAIAPGDMIVVLLKSDDVAPNAPIPAAFVGVVKVPDPSLTGTVQSIDTASQSFTLLGRTVYVTPQTRFVGGLFRSISGLSDLASGQIALVQANATGGRLVAESVMVMSMMPAPIKRIHGTVKTIGTDSWTITDDAKQDIVVEVNSETKILGSPVVGSIVDVLAIVDSSNRTIAISIIRIETGIPPSAPFAAYRGVVKKISVGEWVVRDDASRTDLTFTIANETKIEPGIGVNDRVAVMARSDSRNNLVAIAIMRDRM